jgi:hypothetical protein
MCMSCRVLWLCFEFWFCPRIGPRASAINLAQAVMQY